MARCLRPAVPHKPNEVVCLFTGSRDAQRSFRQFSYAEFLALREPNSVFSDVAAVNFNYVSLGREMELRRSFAFMVSENYFRLMGAQPVAGRFFTADETRPNANERVVVASHALWQRQGGRPDFVGSTVLVNGQTHTVVGVSPEGFSGVTALVAPEIWLPFGLFAETTAAFGETPKSRDLSDPKNYSVNLMGRMHPGLTIETAQAHLPALAARLAAVDVSGSATGRDLVLSKPFGINTSPGDAGPLRLVGMLLLVHVGSRVADRLSEPGQHDAGARFGARAGDRGASRAGRHARPDRAPASDRRNRACRDRRSAGSACSVSGAIRFSRVFS